MDGCCIVGYLYYNYNVKEHVMENKIELAFICVSNDQKDCKYHEGDEYGCKHDYKCECTCAPAKREMLISKLSEMQ